jgi:trimeric autotransporter adhesin
MMKLPFALLAIVLASPSYGTEQADPAKLQPLTPLREVLNPDGSIDMNRGFSGSVDPSGWRMVNGWKGEPHFIEAVPADSLWDDRFGPGGTTLMASAIAANGTEVYLGGQLLVGGNATRNLVRWDGANWSAVGTPVNVGDGIAEVRAIALMGSDVYVAGFFSDDGVYGFNKVKKWNGSSWTVLSGSSNIIVYALAAMGTDLYAGGEFTDIAGVSANRIARWNGSSWAALGSGITSFGTVYALAVVGTDLYVGGDFTAAGGGSASSIAKWNGSVWSALGSGTNGIVRALAVSGSNLYAGGSFTTAGGMAASHIALWDGGSWSALGSGLDGDVGALGVSGSDVYAGGPFTMAGGATARGIALWNGVSWTSSLGDGIGTEPYQAGVKKIAVNGTDVYVCGEFSSISGVVARNVARWNGTSWSAIGVPAMQQGIVGGSPSVIAVGGNAVYAGGTMTSAGGTFVNNVARWDGSGWSALGTGIGGGPYPGVYALAVNGSDLFVGGSFTSAGGVTANNIAKWNGTSWSSIGTINGPVFELAVSGGLVIAAGSFTTAGGVSANNIAKWNGIVWSGMGTGINGEVYVLAVSGANVYAGGSFSTAGGVSANNIARWDGTSWSALGIGTTGMVFGMAVSGSTIYAGGQNGTLGWLARWNGSAWSAMPGLSSVYSYWSVRSIAVRGNDVFVGGENITSPGYCLGTWNGTSWSALGSSILYGSSVQSLAVNGGNVYVGGDFLLAGDKPANSISRWLGSPVVTPSLPRGSIGMPLTITGGEFDPIPSNNLVNFGAIPAVVTSSGLNSLIVMVPPGAVSGVVSVTTRNLTGVSSSSFAIWPPGFSASPSSLTFNPTAIGDTTKDTIVVKNPTLGGLYISSVVSTNPHFTVTPSSGMVASGDSLLLTVSFSPTGINPESGGIVFVHNAATSPDTVDVVTLTSALSAGDYTIGLSLFNRLTGRNLVHSLQTRRVTRELAALSSGANRAERADAKVLDGLRRQRVEWEEEYSVLTENDQRYTGPQRVTVSEETRRQLGLDNDLVGVYPTITAALADLDTTGLLGHVRYLFTDSLYPSETLPLDLKVSGAYFKPRPTATITLKPNPGVSTSIQGLSPADDPILRVRADYVTIDGSNMEGGSTRDLSIINYNGVAVALSVWDMITFPDDTVSHVTVKNTILADTGLGGATLTVGPPVTGAGGHYSDIMIDNNEIHGSTYGMWISGYESSHGTDIVVRRNVVEGTRGVGIIVKYSDRVQISGNDVSNFQPQPFGYLDGIRSELGARDVIVERNVVHDLGNGTAGLPGGNGIAVTTMDSLPNVLVRNNIIYGMAGAGASFYWQDNPMGIRIQSPAGGIGVYHNSISLSGSALNEASALSMGIAVGSGGRPDIRNNIIVNNLGLSGGTGIGSCGVYFQDTTNLGSILDHNLYYVNPSGTGVGAIGMVGTTASPTLGAWQAASGQEAHGAVGDPLFVSGTDLHITLPSSPASNAGLFLAAASRDIDNEVRSSLSPDIGADEFAPVPSGVAVALHAGWNMLSNPITASNDSVTQLYPGSAFGYAFSFSSTAGYQQSYRMSNGRGYWTKLVSGGTETLLGPSRSQDSVAVSPGWNMVGSVSYPVDTAAITSVPPGIRTSAWYGYGPGYNPSAEIVPGKAYWVKASAAGKFLLSFIPAPPTAKVVAGGTDPLAGLNTITLTDASGMSQTLYFGLDEASKLDVGLFEMPPAPPSGVLNARFETSNGGSMVQTHGAEGTSVPMTLSTAQYPVVISWAIQGGSPGYTLRDGHGGMVHLEGEGTWRIENVGTNRLVLESAREVEVPTEFALFQNYPNPFNPSTTIRFGLPVASHVTVEIFNILGQRIRSLVNNDLGAGYHAVEWNGRGEADVPLGSGAYLLRLTSEGAEGPRFTQTRKVMIMK